MPSRLPEFKIEQIRRLRRAGWTIERVCERVGCSSTTVLEYTTPRKKIGGHDPEKYADWTDVQDLILALNECGLSQREAAKRVGAKHAAFHWWCNGHARPPRRVVEAVRSLCEDDDGWVVPSEACAMVNGRLVGPDD